MSPEAGWYADPTDDSAVRWWDGASWSTQTRPAPRELALAGAVVGSAEASGSLASLVTVGGPAPVATTPVPTTPAPAAAPSAPSPDPAPAGSDAVVDRSRPGARPPAPAPSDPEPTPAAPEEDVDRSRPGARRAPVTLAPADLTDVAVRPAPAPSRPQPTAPPVAWVDGSAVPGHPTPGFGGSTPGHGAAPPIGFGTLPPGFGPADSGPVHPGTYTAPRSWKLPVVVGVLVVLVVAAGAVVGLPRYRTAQAQAKAEQAPAVLVESAPRSLARQKSLTLPGVDTAALARGVTDSGAAWAWASAYGTRDSFTLYLASDVAMSLRADAVRALSSHDAATTLLAEVSSGLTGAGRGQTVTGTAAEYSSPVGGKTWCMPVTMSGVAGGFCLWTSGKEMLQVLSMPGLEQVAAKSTNTALAQMAAVTTQAAPTSSLVPRASASPASS